MNSSGNHPDFELTFTITIGKERLRKKNEERGEGGEGIPKQYFELTLGALF